MRNIEQVQKDILCCHLKIAATEYSPLFNDYTKHIVIAGYQLIERKLQKELRDIKHKISTKMKGRKTYIVDHDTTGAQIQVSIDFDFIWRPETTKKTMVDLLRFMVFFWEGAEERLSENLGNIVETFLKQLCIECVSILSADPALNHIGVQNKFNAKEGWCTMNGEYGIVIQRVSAPELDYQNDYSIIELKQ